MKLFKSSILSVSVATAGLLMGSCSDSFLDVSSKTESNTETFYKTETDAWRALLGCYDGWRQVSSNPGVGFYVASTVMSDECYGATGFTDSRNYQVIDRFDQRESPADLTIYTTDWKVYYAGVYRCNEMIAHEDAFEWSETNSKQGLYMGECRAIRALLYFDMVRWWGNIPLFTEPVNENREQADPKEVYNLIIEDLKYAAENIPADAYPKSNATQNDGHVTRYAAESMLARVYLYYTGLFGEEPANLTRQEVLDGLEDVVKSNEFALVESYKNLWPASSLVPLADSKGWDAEKSTYAGEANSEVILQMKFTPSQDYNGNNDSNRWQVMMGMRNLTSSPYGKGWGSCTVCPSFLAKYAAGDLRRAASVIDIAGEGIGGSSDWESSVNDWREYTGYTVKKYSPLAFPDGNSASQESGNGDFQITNPQNWVIMRYADVLLMVSELGGVPSKTAQAALDEVRERAGLQSVPATKDNIMAERAVELAFEGHRYWDLMRQGVDVLANAIVASGGEVTDGGTPSYVSFEKSLIVEKKGLSQIPRDQIILSNGVLKQNPGWD
ncbi:MAG: RagB/SusD family nutrient uptake outer membrane protein [Bacteroides sp.]|nr:RagB/SusD family nutrient uptake outer membrane protein [Bacteroides sp.]